MEKIGKIKKVICPYCKREMFRNIRTLRIGFNRYQRAYDWRCFDCVYCFDETWFDTFGTHEHLVLRDGEDKVKWKVNMIKGGDIPKYPEIKLKIWSR